MKHTRLILFLVLLLVPISVYAQRDPPISEIELKSALLGRTISYRILYPVKYSAAQKRDTRFPVLYLLHGLTGHSNDWLEKSRVAGYATHYDLFIVMVEGGNGWYTDSVIIPADKYESYILSELIPDVERRFRVSTQREGRAIAGLSMGGYGAFKFGLKHPEMFALAASMSGAFAVASLTEKELKDPGVANDSLRQTFGPDGSPTRAANDVFKLSREVSAKKTAPLPYFYFDCGTEDFLLSHNRELASLFVELKIPHEYRQLPGNHSWPYWDAQVQEILRLAAQKIRAGSAPIRTAKRVTQRKRYLDIAAQRNCPLNSKCQLLERHGRLVRASTIQQGLH